MCPFEEVCVCVGGGGGEREEERGEGRVSGVMGCEYVCSYNTLIIY
jgi:hypothetical protein